MLVFCFCLVLLLLWLLCHCLNITRKPELKSLSVFKPTRVLGDLWLGTFIYCLINNCSHSQPSQHGPCNKEILFWWLDVICRESWDVHPGPGEKCHLLSVTENRYLKLTWNIHGQETFCFGSETQSIIYAKHTVCRWTSPWAGPFFV